MIAQLMSAFILVLIGFYMLGPISEQIKQINITPENSLATQQLLGLVPFFFVIAILGAAIGIVFSAFKTEEPDYLEDEVEEEPTEPKPHKQTYEEYVDERLRVERKLSDA